jgi:ABC-type lipoprotein export system ATPase subunit
MSRMLEITDVHKQYHRPEGAVHALHGVSLHVDEGEFVVVRGPSGCGKTTLLLTAGGLLSPDAGQVLVEGRDLYALASEDRARLRAATIGFMFQEFHLIPYLTVLENVMAPSVARPVGAPRERAEELLDRCGLSARARHVTAELSTGERQRTALARALFGRPRLLLADEPTGNLDPDSAAALLAHIAEFARAGGAVLMVTHDDRAGGCSSRVVGMREGELVRAETADQHGTSGGVSR